MTVSNLPHSVYRWSSDITNAAQNFSNIQANDVVPKFSQTKNVTFITVTMMTKVGLFPWRLSSLTYWLLPTVGIYHQIFMTK